MITPAEVRAVTGSALSDAVIQPFITAANTLILAAVARGCGADLTQSVLDQVEIFLASHLLTSTSVGKGGRDIESESLDNKYTVKYLTPKATSTGLMASSYGQIANSLMGGCLGELDKRKCSITLHGSNT